MSEILKHDNQVDIWSREGLSTVKDLFDCCVTENKKLVLFVGSAISLFPDCNSGDSQEVLPNAEAILPNGQAISDSILDTLFPQEFLEKNLSKTDAYKLRVLLRKTAFEHIIEHCPKISSLPKMFAEGFRIRKPNKIHDAIAKLLSEKKIRHVITPNYDDGIERALANICEARAKKISVVIRESDFSLEDRSRIDQSLFKFHGCISAPETMAFALRQEHFYDWKLSCLQSMCENATLIFMGYSGIDIDILPQIYSIRDKIESIVWLYLKGTQPNDSVLKLTQGSFPAEKNFVRVGWDIGHFLGAVCENLGVSGVQLAPISLESGRQAGKKFVSRIFELFGSAESTEYDEALFAWRANLANSLGYPNLARVSADEYREKVQRLPISSLYELKAADCLRMKGHAEYHVGNYSGSVSLFYESIKKVVTVPQSCFRNLLLVHSYSEIVTALRDAQERTASNVENWKKVVVAAINSARAARGIEEIKVTVGFDEVVNSFFQDILDIHRDIEFGSYSLNAILSTLAYHVYLIWRDIVKFEPLQYNEKLVEVRGRFYANATREALNAAGNWRTAQYHEGRYKEYVRDAPAFLEGLSFMDQKWREFPSINDVTASCLMAYKRVDRLIGRPNENKYKLEQIEECEGIIALLDPPLRNAILVGSEPVIWKVMFRKIRLEMWMKGHDIYGNVNPLQVEERIPPDFDKQLASSMVKVLKHFFKVKRDLPVTVREYHESFGKMNATWKKNGYPSGFRSGWLDILNAEPRL